MAGYSDEIKEIEKEIGKTKYNKATEHHIGLLKAKVAKLKEREEIRGAKKGGAHGYEVRKTGDGTAILVGYPSVGKSTLLNSLTDANSRVGAYAFTTLTVIPGVLAYNHAKIQILDVPGIVKGAAVGTGRGKEVLSVIRNTDLVIYVIDVNHPEHYDVLKKEVYDTNVRVNQRKPDVKIIKTGKDGIKVQATLTLTKISEETIKTVMNEFRIMNAEVLIREDINVDQLIDCIEDNKKYVPGMIILNKMDMVPPEQVEKTKKLIHADLAISAEQKINIDKLKDLIFEKLLLVRIFMKEPRKEADLTVPLIAFKDSTVEMICNKLHKDFAKKFKFCRIWGKSAKFPGQKLTIKHVLHDEDILEIHLR